MPRPKGLPKTGGRQKGVANKRTREIADAAAREGLTPLEYMLGVMRDEEADPERRDRMAAAAASISPRVRATSVTCAPASARAEAAANPIPRPAPVTSARLPASGRSLVNRPSIAETISSGSDMRPGPYSLHAMAPSLGPTKWMPRFRSVSTLAWVAACVHMRTFMAGAADSYGDAIPDGTTYNASTIIWGANTASPYRFGVYQALSTRNGGEVTSSDAYCG